MTSSSRKPRPSKRKSKYTKLSAGQIKTIITKYKSGLKARAIAREVSAKWGFRVPHTSVQSHIDTNKKGGVSRAQVTAKQRAAVRAAVRTLMPLRKTKRHPRKKIAFQELKQFLEPRSERWGLQPTQLPARTKLSKLVRELPLDKRRRVALQERRTMIPNKESTPEQQEAIYRMACRF